MPDGSNTINIHAPELLTRRQRFRDGIITGLMWLVYSYLWAPFISLIAWLLGFEFAYNVMIRAGGIHGLYRMLWFYGLVIGIIVIVIIAWSLINRRRFADSERRRAIDPVSDEAMAEYFGIEPKELGRARSLRVAQLEFGPGGELEEVADLDEESYLRGSRRRNARSQIMSPATSAR